MSNPTNVVFSLDGSGGSVSQIFMLDRWSSPDVLIALDSIDQGSIAIEGTTQRINLGETPIWNDLYGTSADTLALETYDSVDTAGIIDPIPSPIEAMRITTAGNATVAGRVMQAARS